MKKLRRCGWHDDHEILIYFVIEDEGKEIWQSQWVDIRDIYDEDFRAEILEACQKHGFYPENFDVANWD